MTDPQLLSRLMPEVLAIAREAGRAILEVYRTDFEVETKDDDSPLTRADLAAHRIILDGLARLTPELPVLSEESVEEHPWEERRGWSRYWLVDPLDGTREFIKRNGEFTVNIALVDEHRPVLGVVHVPAKGWDYYGSEASGAARVVDGGEPEVIRVTERARSPLRIVGSRSHRGSSLDAFLASVGEHEMLPMGSSLKFCLVAEGSADVYPRLGPTSEWDTGAADAIVRAAGGRVLRLDGEALAYNAEAEILNPYFVAFGDDSRDWVGMLGKLGAGS